MSSRRQVALIDLGGALDRLTGVFMELAPTQAEVKIKTSPPTHAQPVYVYESTRITIGLVDMIRLRMPACSLQSERQVILHPIICQHGLHAA